MRKTEHAFQMERKKLDGYEIQVYKNRPMCVYEMFENTAKYSDRDSIVYKDACLTYSELHDRVNSLASLLKKYNVSKGDRVGILLRNDDLFPTVFMAISKIGAISVIFNTRLTERELSYQMEISEPIGIIADDELWVKSLNKYVEWVLSKSAAHAQLGVSLEKVPTVYSDEEDIHTILFTSGTTGKPKGARILHRNLIHGALRQQELQWLLFRRPEGWYPKTLIAAPLFHVMALQEQLIPCLSMGGTIFLMDEFKVNTYLDIVEKEKIPIIVASPAMYWLLKTLGNLEKRDFGHVELVGFGASIMPQDLIYDLERIFPNAIFFNGFGLTEASLCTSIAGNECLENPTSIGRPTSGTEVKILDENMNEVPRGEVGEIAIRGPQVIGGYYNNPEKTNESFRDGWFLSGDLGKMDENDLIYVVDRKKDIINRGGEKIFCVEVENVLHLHPKILDVAVYGVPDDAFGEEVAASIVPAPQANITHDIIKNFCAEKLADYKIPKYIIITNKLPTNPGGKVIKEKLREDFILKRRSRSSS